MAVVLMAVVLMAVVLMAVCSLTHSAGAAAPHVLEEKERTDKGGASPP